MTSENYVYGTLVWKPRNAKEFLMTHVTFDKPLFGAGGRPSYTQLLPLSLPRRGHRSIAEHGVMWPN